MLNWLALTCSATTPLTRLLSLEVIVELTRSTSDESSVVPAQIYINQRIIWQPLTMTSSLLALENVYVA